MSFGDVLDDRAVFVFRNSRLRRSRLRKEEIFIFSFVLENVRLLSDWMIERMTE